MENKKDESGRDMGQRSDKNKEVKYKKIDSFFTEEAGRAPY